MLLTEFPTLAIIFYDHDLMPCCGKDIKYFKGPQGGYCTNIKCFYCGQKFNINPQTLYIVKI